jgi:hypothetical protein
MREVIQSHTFMEFPPDDIFGMRIYLNTDDIIEVFSTEFQESFKEQNDDGLDWIEYQEGFGETCQLKHVATLNRKEFIVRMNAFLSCLQILDTSPIPLKKRHVDFD